MICGMLKLSGNESRNRRCFRIDPAQRFSTGFSLIDNVLLFDYLWRTFEKEEWMMFAMVEFPGCLEGLYCASTLSWRYRNGKTVALIWPIDKMVELVITELVQCSFNIRSFDLNFQELMWNIYIFSCSCWKIFQRWKSNKATVRGDV